MSRYLLIVFLSIFTTTIASAQSAEITRKRNVQFNDSTLKKNALYVSIGVAQTLTYEVNFANTKRSAWHFKTGLGLNQLYSGTSQHAIAGITYITGRKRKSHFELNSGAVIIFESESYRTNQRLHNANHNISDFVHLNPALYMGYRYQKPGGRFIFRYGYGYPEVVAISFGLGF